MQEIEITTSNRTQCVDITARLQQAVAESGMREGVVVAASAHTTAGMTINENADPDVMADVMEALDGIAPRRGPYAHSEGNSDAHIKSSLVGSAATVPVQNGRLALGTWQGVYFCEFDGPRRRRVFVQLLAAAE